jgi:tetratricopeptide (TPR) repeat protein
VKSDSPSAAGPRCDDGQRTSCTSAERGRQSIRLVGQWGDRLPVNARIRDFAAGAVVSGFVALCPMAAAFANDSLPTDPAVPHEAFDARSRGIDLVRSERPDAAEADALLKLAATASLAHRASEELVYLTQAYAVFREIGDGSRDVGILLRIAEVHRVQNRLGAALQCARAALARASENGEDAERAKAFGCLGVIDQERDRAECSLRLLKRSLAGGRSSGCENQEARLLLAIGRELQSSGRSSEARLCFLKSLDRARSEHARSLESSCLGLLGVLDKSRGRLEPASASFRASLGIALELGDRHTAADLHYNLAELAGAQCQLQRAISHHIRAASIYRDDSLVTDAADAMDRASRFSLRAGDLPAASAFARLSLELSTEAGNSALRAECLAGLSRVFDCRGSRQRASRCLEAAKYAARTIDDWTAVRLGDASASEAASGGQLIGAISEGRRGLVTASEKGDAVGRLMTIASLADFYLESGDPTRAYSCAESSRALAVESSDFGAIVRSDTCRAGAMAELGDWAHASEVASSAVEAAIGRDDLSLQMSTLLQGSVTFGRIGNRAQALDLLRHGLVLACEAGDEPMVTWAMMTYSRFQSGLRALAADASFQRSARRSGWAAMEAMAWSYLAEDWFEAGDLDRAQESARKSVALMLEQPEFEWISEPWGVLVECALRRGAFDGARSLMVRMNDRFNFARDDDGAYYQWNPARAMVVGRVRQDFVEFALADSSAATAVNRTETVRGFLDCSNWKGRTLTAGISTLHRRESAEEPRGQMSVSGFTDKDLRLKTVDAMRFSTTIADALPKGTAIVDFA